jgi:hypothetical protein
VPKVRRAACDRSCHTQTPELTVKSTMKVEREGRLFASSSLNSDPENSVCMSHEKSPALWGHGAAKGDGGFALGGNHKHTEIPKQGESWAYKQKPRPRLPDGRGFLWDSL